MAKKNDESTTEMAKTANSELAAPDYISEGVEGFENMRQKDLAFPRIVLMQALSPTVEEGTYRAGDMTNSISEELICGKDDTRRFVPISHWLEWIEWIPRAEGGGIRNFSRDPESDVAKRCSVGEKIILPDGRETFAVTEYHTFLIAFIDLGLPTQQDLVCLSCGKSNHKIGKKLLNLARFRGSFPLYAGAYILESISKPNQDGSKYQMLSVKNDGWIGKDGYEVVKDLHTKLKDVSIRADAGENPGETGTVDDPELS